MEKIGTKLSIQRKMMGLTLGTSVKKVGISPMTLERIEAEKSNPSVILLSEIANHLDKSILSFLPDPGDSELPNNIRRGKPALHIEPHFKDLL